MAQLIRDFVESFRRSPAVRFTLRVIVAAALGYVIGILDTGEPFTTRGLIYAVITGAGKLIIGYFTPEEPLVGVNKVAIEIPASAVRSIRRDRSVL